jgi:hypothetical protein
LHFGPDWPVRTLQLSLNMPAEGMSNCSNTGPRIAKTLQEWQEESEGMPTVGQKKDTLQGLAGRRSSGHVQIWVSEFEMTDPTDPTLVLLPPCL